jgi:transcription elongation factor Elf1
MKEPKRYLCYECGYKSSRCKVIQFSMVGFAACFKCRGRVKETDEWQSWYKQSYENWRASQRAVREETK